MLTHPDAVPLIFSGNSNKTLATKITSKLRLKLGKIDVEHFSDGEVRVELQESVRGRDVFVIQSTCAPTNTNLMELLIMIDAFRRSAAASITAVIPYYGYARQDRRPYMTRTPISSKLIANMITTAGASGVITVDIHSEQQQGFFDIPVINTSASPEIIGDIWRVNGFDEKSLVMVSPDTGGVPRARTIAKELDNADLAIIDKRRPRANVSQVMNIIGDVDGCHCVIVDDMIDTAGTLCKGAQALKDAGAASVIAYATHAVFSNQAIDTITDSVLDEVVVADTIPLQRTCEKIRVISVSNLLAETIQRVFENRSVSALYS